MKNAFTYNDKCTYVVKILYIYIWLHWINALCKKNCCILWKLMYKNFPLTIKQYGGKKGIVVKNKMVIKKLFTSVEMVFCFKINFNSSMWSLHSTLHYTFTMTNKGVLQLTMQLNFWVVIIICNSLDFYVVSAIRQVAWVVIVITHYIYDETHCNYVETTCFQLLCNSITIVTITSHWRY